MNQIQYFTEEKSPRFSDEIIRESTAGRHQKLVRTADGHHVLIVRFETGIVQNIPVLAFEGGFQL
jgi:hypothetical protein